MFCIMTAAMIFGRFENMRHDGLLAIGLNTVYIHVITQHHSLLHEVKGFRILKLIAFSPDDLRKGILDAS